MLQYFDKLLQVLLVFLNKFEMFLLVCSVCLRILRMNYCLEFRFAVGLNAIHSFLEVINLINCFQEQLD